MLAKGYSATVMGIDALLIEGKAHIERQLPDFAAVGLSDKAVKESKECVDSAIKIQISLFHKNESQ